MENKKETAPEVPVQEQYKCEYLGCNNIGTILDDVEVSTNFIAKDMYAKNMYEN